MAPSESGLGRWCQVDNTVEFRLSSSRRFTIGINLHACAEEMDGLGSVIPTAYRTAANR